MTHNDWANAQETDEYHCRNCGRTLPVASSDVDQCSECCSHDNVTEELTGTYCDDCGEKVA